jgi:polyphosphate kinase 2 (PPK2 family)
MAARDKALDGGAGKAKREKVTRKEYEKHLAKLHVELVKVTEWIKEKGLKVCILFEGRDGAGRAGSSGRSTNG